MGTTSARPGPSSPRVITVLRLLAAVLLGAAGTLGFALSRPAPAYAAGEDRIDSFAIAYEVAPSGVLHVTETIDWRFGSSSGRHGIQRDLVTREPDPNSDNDFVYDVSQISVRTTGGVSGQVSTSTTSSEGGRSETLNIRIGSPDRTISAPTAQYVLSYDVAGAIRTFNGYDELFWDGPGFGNPLIASLSITATVPGGAEEVSCFTGPPRSTTPCTSKEITSGGKATFTQKNVARGDGVSFGVKIAPGLVTDNAPHLQPNGSKLTSAQKVGVGAVGAVGLAALVGSPLVGMAWWRRHGRDQRYAGLAPGTTPQPGQPATVVMNDPDIPIPVQFSPPKIPVAEAGLLVDGQVDTRETAATIIDLAVKGALTVQSTGERDFQITLADPDRATAPHEMVLLTSLFDGRPPGAVKDLAKQGSLTDAHNAMRTSVVNQVTSRGWFTKVPSGARTGGALFGVVALIVFGAFSLSPLLLLLLVPVLPVVVTAAVIRAKLRRGQRTPQGRAVCDQVEGFRTYLATAEADQLRFEEGEDIFSRYLPWAIAFDLADRWAKLCGELVAMGRLPDRTPSWYYGSYNMSAFNVGFLTSSLTSAATPAPTTSGSGGTGFGGGSSFGGGGFSGGGGGGGGSGSW
ncbi:MAG: hypothetical protein JWP61_1297 [Friedmanniella sp.]|nr:hypothetical protein [Friedmanniella sp.]